MSRDAQNQAKQTYNTSAALTDTSQANTGNLYNTLVPTYTAEAANPQGFDPTTKANMTTAAEQSAGGALGAATGQAARLAASNKNIGGFAPALDEASRDASKNLSNATLGVQNEDATLKEAKRQQGIQGLQGVENQQNSDILSSLGLQNESTNTDVNAGNSGWFQNMLEFMNAAGKIKPA